LEVEKQNVVASNYVVVEKNVVSLEIRIKN
jgi:hypothetical protein